jgi:hypothetical protein
VHFRSDFPETSDAWLCNTVQASLGDDRNITGVDLECVAIPQAVLHHE